MTNPPIHAEEPQEVPPPAKRRGGLKPLLMTLAIVAVVILGFRLVNTLNQSPFAKAAEKCDIPALLVLADNDKTMMLSTSGDSGYEVGDIKIDEVVCVLQELEVPRSVVSHMDSTRALDGQQTAEWGKIAARWTYHPSRGLDIVLTTKR